jgi:hypothetical protein
LSYHEYVELLGVPDIDPTAGADALHIAHLVENPETLCALLRADIPYYGQFKRLREQNALTNLFSTNVIEEIEARAAVIDAFSKAARVGRAKPLTPEVLQQEKLSENFQRQVLELSKNLDWDARRLIQALDPDNGKAISGFRRASVERMQDNFLRAGYLHPDEPLEREEVQARVISEVAPFLESKLLDHQKLGGIFKALWSRL